MPQADVDRLRESYACFWTVQSAARLLTGEALDVSALGEGGRSFLLRQTGAASIPALEQDLVSRAETAAALIDRALERDAKAG